MRNILTYHVRAWFIACVSICWILNCANAQQDWSYAQYLFNLYDVNAAYAGNHHALSGSVRHRAQWVGLEGAPQSQQVSLHAPLAGEKLGVGVRIQRESIGARQQWMVRGSAGYRIPIRDGSFSFALAGGLIRQELNPGGIAAQDWNDPQLDGQHWRSTSVSFDAAIFFHTTKWFAGIEANRLNRSAMQWSDQSLARSFIHVNAVGGRYLKIGGNDLLAFTGLLRFSEPGLLQSDLNISWLWNNRIWFGAGYRTEAGPIFLIECNVNRQLRIGYSYDTNLQAMRGYQDGSHEILVAFNLKPRDDRSIRQF